MKYILDYLREEMFIEPIAGVTIDIDEEYSDVTTPVGYRLVLNGKETDIGVWYADYYRWIEKKYDELKSKIDENI